MQKGGGGYFFNDHVVFKGGHQKTTSVHMGGGGLKNPKNLTTWFKDGPLWCTKKTTC